MDDSIFIAGLDLGQVSDPTALAILQRPRIRTLTELAPVYSVRYLSRFPLGTSYPAIVSGVRDILTRPPLDKAHVFLAVDKTGCGAAVCDLLRPIFPGFAAISITAGEQASAGPAVFNVPKRELAGIVQVLLQTRRLLVAQGLPEAQQLKRELQNFKVKINIATGNESFEAWREKDHDDLVLAVAMAAWLGEQIAVGEREAIEEAAEAEMPYYRAVLAMREKESQTMNQSSVEEIIRTEGRAVAIENIVDRAAFHGEDVATGHRAAVDAASNAAVAFEIAVLALEDARRAYQDVLTAVDVAERRLRKAAETAEVWDEGIKAARRFLKCWHEALRR